MASCAVLGCVWAYRSVLAQVPGASAKTDVAASTPAPSRQDLAGQFKKDFKPFLDAYCVDCHSGGSAVADLDLDAGDLDAMTSRSAKLFKMAGRISNKQMPPATADKQPTA